jgi:hypothetical protein
MGGDARTGVAVRLLIDPRVLSGAAGDDADAIALPPQA